MTWIGWLGTRPDGWTNPYWLALAELGDEADMEDRIERAWLAKTIEPRSRRRRFTPQVLRSYPLTQPPDICARCLRWTGNEDYGWDLDHIVELQFGGLDHPTNLVRLCLVCHRSKPLPPESLWGDQEAMRQLAIAWVRRGPLGGVRLPFRSGLSPKEIAELDADLAADTPLEGGR